MNAQGFLAHYARIADTPDAIAKLREFILDLAVRGKLVDQGGGKESASKLLAKICIDAVHLSGKHKRDNSDALSDRAPFIVPNSWAWTTLGTIARYGNPAKVNSNDELRASTWVLDLEDIEKNTGRLLQRMDSLARPFQSSKTHFNAGDVLFGKLRPYLCKVLVAAEAGVCTTEIVPISPAEGVSSRFLELVMRSRMTMSKVEQLMYGVKMPRLGTSDANRLLFPLPPSEEQHRIVAKVDELMALCDQLEAARAQREAKRDQLAAASLARLNAPDPDTFSSNVRFAIDALPALTTRPDQIKQLRQTILNLAVFGKLVPQDPDDEHSSILLAKICEENARQIEAGEVPRAKASTRDVSRLKDSLPLSWMPIALGDVCSLVTSGSRGWAEYYANTGAGFIRAQNIRFGVLNLEKIAHVNPPPNSEGGRTKVEKDDLLVVITGAGVTNPALLEIELPEAYVSQHVGLVRPTEKKLSKWLLLCLMADEGGRAELVERAYGAGKPGLNLDNIRSLSLPLPPLTEQHRIVAKVDELIKLCDELEASLSTGEATRSRLLDELLHEALSPVILKSNKHPRAAVSSYVISRLSTKRNFGRTAHMKYLFLAEARLGLNLGGRYMREAAGPLDTGIYELEKQAEAAGWYIHSVETLASGNEKVSYKQGKVLAAIVEEGIAVLGPARAEMDRMIDLMGRLKTEQVEIITTLFAAWNDALLDSHAPDDDWIVKEVREHWHVSKQRFAPADLHTWLKWMRQNDVVPLGHPPRTMQQITMDL